LWKINTGSGFCAPPMTFEINGKQYLAITSGPNTAAKAKLVNTPELKEQRNATVLYVFALKRQQHWRMTFQPSSSRGSPRPSAADRPLRGYWSALIPKWCLGTLFSGAHLRVALAARRPASNHRLAFHSLAVGHRHARRSEKIRL
jgi:hypothetical protein